MNGFGVFSHNRRARCNIGFQKRCSNIESIFFPFYFSLSYLLELNDKKNKMS